MAKKIVIVDDCKATLLWLYDVFTYVGHDVVTFNKPLEAIDMMPSLNPDIVICYYMMFDMVGTDVIHELRELNIKAKYILLTSLDNLTLKKFCKEKDILYIYNEGNKSKIFEGINV